MRDYYAVLDITQSAQLAEIKKAYRRLALEYHPDRNHSPEAPERFIAVTEAYEVLRDTERRREYDLRYRQHISDAELPTVDADFEFVYRQWQERSRAKAQADASIDYEIFARRLAKEFQIGVSYVPNLIAMFFTAFGAVAMVVMLPDIAGDSGGGAAFLLLFAVGLGSLTYKLFGVMRSDYAEDRKRKL